MTRYLVDTNIPSELTRLRPDEHVTAFLDEAGKENLYLSILTLGEICKGIAQLPASKRRNELQEWLDSILRPWFEGRILPVTATIAERWGQLAAQAKHHGFPLSVIDGLLAATALKQELTLVTRNVKDFAGLGLHILNPWESGTKVFR